MKKKKTFFIDDSIYDCIKRALSLTANVSILTFDTHSAVSMASVEVELEAELRGIKAKLSDGTFTLREQTLKNCKAKLRNTIRLIINEKGEQLKNTYACSMTNCLKIFVSNLTTEGTGKLRRHYQMCNHS